MHVYGVVLAGGRSRRMQGPDKAFVDLGGHSLLARMLERLRPQCRGVLVSGHADPSRYAAFGADTVKDDVPGFAGPVAGLLAALDWIADRHPAIEAAVTCAVDTPFLPPDLVERLLSAARNGGTPCACAASGGRRHPVAALWPVAARHAVRRALEAEDQRRLSVALDAIGCREATWPVDPYDPFLNINTPADLEAARRLIEDGRA